MNLEIGHDEDIYEGKLYGWRWFTVAHGLWSVVPPMFSAKFTRDNGRFTLCTTTEGEEYFELLRNYLNVIDLFDWNQSDVPPDYPRIYRGKANEEVQRPLGHSSGFHLFTSYKKAVNYAIVPYGAKLTGLALPQNNRIRVPDTMTEHMMPSSQLALKVTPLLAFVEASGAVVEHELGYRAHLLRIVDLYSDGRKAARAQLADNIGWPGEIKKFRKLRSLRNPTETQLRRLDCD